MVFVYAGSLETGEVLHALIRNDDMEITKTIEGFIKALGPGSVVWAIYNASQTEEVRDVQFNNYLNTVFQTV